MDQTYSSWYRSMCAKVRNENKEFQAERMAREAEKPKVVVKEKSTEKSTDKKQPIIERKKG